MSWHDHRGYVDPKPKQIQLVNFATDLTARTGAVVITSLQHDLIIDSITINIPDDIDSTTTVTLRDVDNTSRTFSGYTINKSIHADEKEFIPTFHKKEIETIYLKKGQQLTISFSNPKTYVTYIEHNG